MAKISIANLNANESKFSLVPLGETELIKTAVERAIDTRRISGGQVYFTRGMTVGMIADIQ